MKRRTRFTIGVALVVSAVTTLISFLVLCFKKKNIWAAILAVAAAESALGFALIEDKIPAKITFRRKSAEEELPPEEIVVEVPLEEVSPENAETAEASETV